MATNVEISKRLVAINSASTVGRHILTITVLVWLQQYLIRRIPAEEYSLLAIVMAVLVVVPLLSTVLTGGVSRYVIHAAARGDERGVTQVVSTILPLLVGAAVLVFAVMGTVTWFIGDILIIEPEFLNDARLMLGVSLLSFCVRMCLAPLHTGFHVRQKFVLRNIIELGSELLFIGILFTLLFGVSVRVLWIPVARFVARSFEEVVVVVISRRLLPSLRFRLGEFRRSLVRELLSFGGWKLVGKIGGILEKAANPIILNRGAGATELAAFHIGTMPHRAIPGLMGEGLWMLFPALTAMEAKGDDERLATTFLRSGRLAIWAVMLICVPAMVFAPELFELYLGLDKFQEYSSAFAVMILVLATYPTYYSRIMLSSVALAKGQIRGITIVKFCSQLFCILLAGIFVFRFQLGAVGGALGVFIGHLLFDFAVFWPMSMRTLNIRFGTFLRKTLIPGLVPMTVAGAIGLVLRDALRPDDWLLLGLCGVAVGGAYIAALLLFCMEPEDKKDFVRLVKLAGGFLRRQPSV